MSRNIFLRTHSKQRALSLLTPRSWKIRRPLCRSPSTGSCFSSLRIVQAYYRAQQCRFLNADALLGRSIHTDAKLCHHRRCRGAVFSPFIQQQSLHTSSTYRCKPSSSDENDPSLAYLKSGKEYLDGPDQILPSDAVSTWHARGAVRLGKLGVDPGASVPPISIPSMFLRTVEERPNIPALAAKVDGSWKFWTYEEYYDTVRKAARAFISLGLERYHSVCILGSNCPEWFISNLGAMMAGGIPAGIYTTNSASSCAFIAEDSKANIYVVEDEQQLSKILQYKNRLPHLKAIIQFSGTPTCEEVLSWEQFLALGETETDTVLNERLKHIAINQCSTLIYTSGTTGKAKGVMLSHDNITWLCNQVLNFANFDNDHEEVVSYLPLSHIAAQTADIYFPMFVKGTVYFADRDALKGTLINTLRDVQPTKFLAVPRVWEKMYETLRDIGSKNTGLKLKLATWAKEQGTLYNRKVLSGDPNPSNFQFQLADKIILSQIRKALGLSRCDLAMTAAAPISIDILEYFMSLNIVIGEVYGLSECSGPHTMSVPEKNMVKFGSIGVTIPGAGSRIDKPKPDGQGELCLGGRHVLMGYLHREDTTKEAIDEEGWFHTEDLVTQDEDGFFQITGRIKELLITAGGENVAPVPIEDLIKQGLPCLSNVMVIGDRLKYLSVFLCFRTEMNQDTNEPLEKLVPSCKEWIDKHGNCDVNTIKELMEEVYTKKNSKLINAISTGVMVANSKAVSRAQKVQRWVILQKDFSIPGGELGPTMKLKRKFVIEKYKDLIDDIYKDGQDQNPIGVLG